MKRSTVIWVGLIVVLGLCLVGVWGLILTGNFPSALSLLPTETPTPTATATTAPTSTATAAPTATEAPEDTPTPEATETSPPELPDTPPPPPPFPTPQAISEPPERPLRIGYMSAANGDWEIIIADADGGNPENISNDEGFDAFARWTPYNDQVLWLTDRFGPGVEVVVADIDGSNLENVSRVPQSDDFSAAWSPTGQWIAYISTRFGDGEIFLSTPGGESFNVSDHEANDVFFDWSPACAELEAGDEWTDCRILLGSDRSGDRGTPPGEYILYSVSADGSGFDFVVNLDTKAAEAAYSPDGSQILYSTVNTLQETGDLFLFDVASGDVTQLTDDETIEAAVGWSPTGLITYISDSDGDPDIYIIDPADGEIVNLTDNDNGDALNGDYAWSPDGSQVLFSTDRDENVEIYVMDADGGNPTNLTNSPGPEIEAFWVQ